MSGIILKHYVMKAMIFAAGLGTRLKPLTDTLPKALVPVCGKPLIEHVLNKLAAAGITETVVNVHHFADMLEEWLAGRSCAGGNSEMKIYVSDEREMLLDTGGAVLHARPFLENCGNFLVHNVDILSNCNLQRFVSMAGNDAVATLLVSRRKTRRYLLFEPDTMRLAGWTDTSTGRVRMSGTGVALSDCVALAFSGIHILSDKIFGIMEEYVRANAQDGGSVNPEKFSITDFYIEMAARYPIYGVCDDSLELLDVGKLDALAPAEAFLNEQKYLTL